MEKSTARTSISQPFEMETTSSLDSKAGRMMSSSDSSNGTEDVALYDGEAAYSPMFMVRTALYAAGNFIVHLAMWTRFFLDENQFWIPLCLVGWVGVLAWFVLECQTEHMMWKEGRGGGAFAFGLGMGVAIFASVNLVSCSKDDYDEKKCYTGATLGCISAGLMSASLLIVLQYRTRLHLYIQDPKGAPPWDSHR